jgi:hypothetical protein
MLLRYFVRMSNGVKNSKHEIRNSKQTCPEQCRRIQNTNYQNIGRPKPLDKWIFVLKIGILVI